jgi:hypothetical protein
MFDRVARRIARVRARAAILLAGCFSEPLYESLARVCAVTRNYLSFSLQSSAVRPVRRREDQTMLPTNSLPICSVILLTACGAQPTNEDYDDIATSVGALVSADAGGEGEAASDAVMIATGELPAGLTNSGSGTISGRRGSLDYSFELTCTDASAQTMDACSDLTDEARLVLHWEGEIDTARWNATFLRDGDWTLRDIQSGTATLDGNGKLDVDAEFAAIYRPVTKSFRLDYDATYEGVKIRVSDRALVGGRAVYEIHAERTVERRGRTGDGTLDVLAEVTFNEDETATVVLDGVRTYRAELATGTVELQVTR